MNLKEFHERVKSIYEESTHAGGSAVASHKGIEATIRVRSTSPDDDADYEIVGIEPDNLIGCGCWAGAIIEIVRKP